MPIKPENRHLYPKNWKEIRQRILERANHKCEFCGVENHSLQTRYRQDYQGGGKEEYKIKVVLTIAHLDNDPTNNSPENLRALCQKCHLTYDAKFHAANARRTRYAKQNEGQLNLFEPSPQIK